MAAHRFLQTLLFPFSPVSRSQKRWRAPISALASLAALTIATSAAPAAAFAPNASDEGSAWASSPSGQRTLFLWTETNGQFADDGEPIADSFAGLNGGLNGGLKGTIGPRAQRIDLLAWLKSKVIASFPTPEAIGKYNRRKHFGGWVRAKTGSCLNTRALVLVRDAHDNAVQYDRDKPCIVRSGDWDDPYSGREFREASALQIDHVVPLRHAYYAGAYKWAAPKRCHYANFLASSYHLLTVSGHENMSKSDKAPDRYLPPARAYRCAYVGVWMKIKAIWNLDADPDETHAIERTVADFACDARTQTMAQSELDAMREQASSPIDACANRTDEDGGDDRSYPQEPDPYGEAA